MTAVNASSYHISNLLEKMTSADKDYRFMAINDLTTELQKDSIKLDDESERKVIKQLLKLLEDKNGEVQNLAVRCLGPLTAKLKEYQTEMIVDQLCNNMLSDNEQLRDISSIGLKTVIQELPQGNAAMVGNICKKITGRLTSAITKQRDVPVQLEALDILGDLLAKYGSMLLNFHASVNEALLPLLKSQRMAVRKRTYNAIGYLVMSCSNHIFAELLTHIINELCTKNAQLSDEMNMRTYRTYVQCVCAITRQAGNRIGRFIERLIPLITAFCNQEGASECDDELREHCIQTFELFVRRCPLEITPHLSDIIDISLKFVTYDPNYNYDDDEAIDDDYYGDEDDEDDYSDDEDMSWKVRRASAKCIESIVSSRPERLNSFYSTVSLPLIRRFKERDESVKVDIFNAYIALVKHTCTVSSNAPCQTVTTLSGECLQPMDVEDTSISKLLDQVPEIVKSLQRHLTDKSIRTRQCCFTLLSNLVTTIPGCLANHLPALMDGIKFSLSAHRNNSSTIKIDILNFLHVFFLNHEPQIIQPHIKELVPLIIGGVNDSFYKITSDALRALQDLVKIICTPNDQQLTENYDELIYDLYQATLHRLRASDIDQEVKEGAITCMGQIMSSAGDRLINEVPVTLQIFLDRLKNEITRLTTVKSLTIIAEARKINLDAILAPAVPVLANFLRKNQRSLKISTLKCLDQIFKNYSYDVTMEMMSAVVQELPNLIDESDLHIAQLSLQLLTLMLSHPSSKGMKPLLCHILPKVFAIVKSPLLQGNALKSVLYFLQILVSRPEDGSKPFVSFREILRSLIQPIYPQQHLDQPQRSSSKTGKSDATASESLHKQAYHSTAKSIAALVAAEPSECAMIVGQFMSDVQNENSTDSIRTFVLLSLGEIGQQVDLSGYKDLEAVVMGAFIANNEEVKSAASFSLGRICIGNLPYYLPGMLAQIENQTRSHYLLLHSLKETISNAPQAELDSYVGNIWTLLFHHAESSEEGTRNVVAECLGKLTLIHPSRLLPELKSHLQSPSPLVRSTVVTAAKFTISDQPQSIDPLLRDNFGDFLELIQDPQLNVRLVTLTLLNSAAHNKPILIRELLPTVLPKLYQETMIRKDLIREVMMGPFRHSVDDGLDVRKAAFECMYTLLDTSFNKLDIFKFLEYVENGLKDNYDIKMLTFHLLIRMSSLCPVAVLQHVDRLVEPLRATCLAKVKADSVKQEFEKQDELKRSALRAIHALLAIPEANKSPAMSEFLQQIRVHADLSAMYENVQKDSAGATSALSSQMSCEAMDTS